MIRVRYTVEFDPEDRPTELPGDTRAVLASTCSDYDIGQGGVTFEEVTPENVAAIITYPFGSELFIESSAEGDVLDDTDEMTGAATRIWWRVVVVREEVVQ